MSKLRAHSILVMLATIQLHCILLLMSVLELPNLSSHGLDPPACSALAAVEIVSLFGYLF
jgi:hypothetical protein